MGVFLYNLYKSTAVSDILLDEVFGQFPRNIENLREFIPNADYEEQVILISEAIAELRWMKRKILELQEETNSSCKIIALKEKHSYHFDMYAAFNRHYYEFKTSAAFKEFIVEFEKIFLGGAFEFSVDSELETLKPLINGMKTRSAIESAKKKFDKIRSETLSNILILDLTKTQQFSQAYEKIILEPKCKRIGNCLLIPIAVANTDCCGDVRTKYDDASYSSYRNIEVDSFDELFSYFDSDQSTHVYVNNENLTYGLEQLTIPCFNSDSDWYLHNIDLSYSIDGDITKSQAWILLDLKKLRRIF